MEKIKIDVQNGLACDKNRYCAAACRGRFTVVKFEFWGDYWFFDTNYVLGVHHGTGVSIPGKEFPVGVFKTICQASCLLHLGLDEFPEIELTAKAKKLLHIQ